MGIVVRGDSLQESGSAVISVKVLLNNSDVVAGEVGDLGNLAFNCVAVVDPL